MNREHCVSLLQNTLCSGTVDGHPLSNIKCLKIQTMLRNEVFIFLQKVDVQVKVFSCAFPLSQPFLY